MFVIMHIGATRWQECINSFDYIYYINVNLFPEWAIKNIIWVKLAKVKLQIQQDATLKKKKKGIRN